MKKIAKLREELEITAPVAGDAEWDVASELPEAEQLLAMGVVVKPKEETSTVKRSRKGKGREVPTDGHVVFVDEKADRESSTGLRQC